MTPVVTWRSSQPENPNKGYTHTHTHAHTHAHTHTHMHTLTLTHTKVYRVLILGLSYSDVLCCVKPLQSCPTLCNPMDCSPPVSSVHGILQGRILEWGASFFSKITLIPNIKLIGYLWKFENLNSCPWWSWGRGRSSHLHHQITVAGDPGNLAGQLIILSFLSIFYQGRLFDSGMNKAKTIRNNPSWLKTNHCFKVSLDKR